MAGLDDIHNLLHVEQGEESTKRTHLRITHEQGQQDHGWSGDGAWKKIDRAHHMRKPSSARMKQQGNGSDANHAKGYGDDQELKDIHKRSSKAKVREGCHIVLQSRREILRCPLRERGEAEHQRIESWQDAKGQQKEYIGQHKDISCCWEQPMPAIPEPPFREPRTPCGERNTHMN